MIVIQRRAGFKNATSGKRPFVVWSLPEIANSPIEVFRTDALGQGSCIHNDPRKVMRLICKDDGCTNGEISELDGESDATQMQREKKIAR